MAVHENPEDDPAYALGRELGDLIAKAVEDGMVSREQMADVLRITARKLTEQAAHDG